MPHPTTAFIGLGTMGYPMAGHLAKAGHKVTVFNRTAARAEAWCENHSGERAGTPAEAVSGADMVFICVGNDEDVHAVALGDEGALVGMAAGAVLVDHSTVSAHLARELADAALARNVGFLDAPVSGGQAGAENGALTIMVGGEEAVFERAAPVMDAYANAVTLMGPVGSGQLTKMVNQITVAGLIEALAEGLAFAVNAGLDAKKVADVISKGAAASWQMENRAGTMLDGEFDFGFAVDWMLKDLDICLEEARRNGSELPVTELVNRFYKEIQKAGGGRRDTSSLIGRLPCSDSAKRT
jgi:3-hydroxyisobutyrate dehydrogenase-like beta-hydroxyacid dehydrogenase